MSTIYCNTVGCKKQAHYTKHQRHFCESCLRSYEQGIVAADKEVPK